MANTIQRLMVLDDRDEIKYKKMFSEPDTIDVKAAPMDSDPKVESDVEKVVPLKLLKGECRKIY